MKRIGDDLIDGFDSYTWPDGSKYEGEWKNGEKNGHGIYTWVDGKKYVGHFKNGKRNGHGVYSEPDGNQYEVDGSRINLMGKVLIIGPMVENI